MILRNYLLIAICCLGMFTVGPPLLHAQGFSSYEQPENHRWLSSGIGFGSRGIAVGIGYMHQRRISAFSLRYIEQFFFSFSEPDERDRELGVLYGIHLKSVLTLSAGLSISWGVRRGDASSATNGYERRTYGTIGIPLEIQLAQPLFKKTETDVSSVQVGSGGVQVGLGFTVFANINSQGPFYGFLINLLLGKLPKTKIDK